MDICVDGYESYPWVLPAKVLDGSPNSVVALVVRAYGHKHIWLS
jgi:hypothetical protein